MSSKIIIYKIWKHRIDRMNVYYVIVMENFRKLFLASEYENTFTTWTFSVFNPLQQDGDLPPPHVLPDTGPSALGLFLFWGGEPIFLTFFFFFF